MKKKLVTRLAEEILADENWGLVDPLSEWDPAPLFASAMVKIRRMRNTTLGRLAAHGTSYKDHSDKGVSLYEVHCETWLGKYDSGKECLRRLAATAVAAECMSIRREERRLAILRQRRDEAAA